MSSGKYDFSLQERYGVWVAHDRVCHECREPIDFRDTTIDHVLPEQLENDQAALAKLRADLKLPDDFKINDFGNLGAGA